VPDLWMDVDAALAEVPVNVMPLVDDTDFKTREVSVTFDQAGMDLVWNFVTTAGAYTQTAVTPATSGDYLWTNEGDGMYALQIPASGGATINNDTEGFGWFTGFATGILPWRGPVIGFRAAGLNNLMIDDAFSATRGLAGTALPAAEADGVGGLPISDAGGLDLDAILADTADMQPKLGTPSDLGSGATLAGNLVDVEGQTDDIGAAGAGLTAITDRLPAALVGGRIDASVGAIAADVITDAGVGTDLDTYQAKIDLVDDEGATTDRWVVVWHKNGVPVLASITSPTIQVIKASDGTDLIAASAMTEIGTTETYKYDATTTERTVSGAAYVVIVQATIDGSTRTAAQVMGRDSA